MAGIPSHGKQRLLSQQERKLQPSSSSHNPQGWPRADETETAGEIPEGRAGAGDREEAMRRQVSALYEEELSFRPVRPPSQRPAL